MSEFDERQFVARVCAELDASLDRLSPGVRARLQADRQQALERINGTAEGEAGLLAAVRSERPADAALSTDVQDRLDEIRRQALSRLPADKPRHSGWQTWLGNGWPVAAGMVAASFVLVTAVTSFIDPGAEESLLGEQDLLLVASAEDIELYENLDFYLWLAESGFVDLDL